MAGRAGCRPHSSSAGDIRVPSGAGSCGRAASGGEVFPEGGNPLGTEDAGFHGYTGGKNKNILPKPPAHDDFDSQEKQQLSGACPYPGQKEFRGAAATNKGEMHERVL